MGWLTYLKATAASIPTPSAGKVAQFVDSADGVPKYKDETGTVTSLIGPTGPTGNSLARPTATIASSAGVVTIDLSLGKEVYLLTLTENVTSWVFSNPPAAGSTAEIRVVVTQDAATARTCVSPASAGHTAGSYPWVVSTTLGAVESLGMAIDSAGSVTLFASGVYG